MPLDGDRDSPARPQPGHPEGSRKFVDLACVGPGPLAPHFLPWPAFDAGIPALAWGAGASLFLVSVTWTLFLRCPLSPLFLVVCWIPGPTGSAASGPSEGAEVQHPGGPLLSLGRAPPGKAVGPHARSWSLCGAPASVSALALAHRPLPITRPGPSVVARCASQGLDPLRWVFLSRITMIIIHFCIMNFHHSYAQAEGGEGASFEVSVPTTTPHVPSARPAPGPGAQQMALLPRGCDPEVPPGSRHADRHSPFRIQRVFAACMQRGSLEGPVRSGELGTPLQATRRPEQWTAGQGEAQVAASTIPSPGAPATWPLQDHAGARRAAKGRLREQGDSVPTSCTHTHTHMHAHTIPQCTHTTHMYVHMCTHHTHHSRIHSMRIYIYSSLHAA